jgi:hypothetical protein
MKQELISKYQSILSQSNLHNNTQHIRVSIDTLALMCANLELQLLDSMPFKPTTLISQHIIQNVIEVLNGGQRC